ncbi:MFS transporter [Hazenella coriacea]|uniref:Na+/melibiose symporter-like transporter n=1 Tax=Hazenella coriacea TaxID=1179467 RepID=A0A4R3LDR6_9BACL|nr:MFS transporter [Hazenella coriacea]TCS96454.1 Na+/melibiose symporter-like transporter [Hazenella coriacea]
MSSPSNPDSKGSIYLQLLKNRTLMLLWSGGTISMIGDIFFNMAVVWIVYTHSQSLLQTALIQVVWHLDRILLGPIAGTLVDRWDRKKIMVVTNIFSAIVVGILAVTMIGWEHPSSIIIFITVILLNSLSTFLMPAQYSIMPEVIGKEHLTTATGIFTSISRVAALVGSSVAGVVIAMVGSVWAVIGNSISFLVAAACITFARIPKRKEPSSIKKKPQFRRDLVEGWQVISDQPVVKSMVILTILVNVASFMNPLLPGLVDQQLNGDASILGMLQSAFVIGAIGGGAVTGPLERSIGAGRLLGFSLGITSMTIIGMALSTWTPLSLSLMALRSFGMTIGIVAMGTVIQVLVPEEYRGRVWGISSSLSVIAIPVSSLIGGWLADLLGVVPLFIAGGVWYLGCCGVAWLNRHIRTARISNVTQEKSIAEEEAVGG